MNASNPRELSERVALLSSMVENSAQMALAVAPGGRIVYANPATTRLCAYSEAEVRQRSLDQLFRLTEAHRAEVERAIREGAATSFETLAVRRDGTEFPVQLSVSPLHPDAAVRGTVVVATDITKRKRAEEALRVSEEKYRLLFENVNDAVCLFDPELTLLSISPSVEEILGYRPDELVGRQLGELGILSPASQDAVTADIKEVLAGGWRPLPVYELIAKDGTSKIVEANGAVLRRDGEVVAFVAVLRDMTGRMRTEEALYASEERFRNLTEHIPGVSIQGYKTDGEVVYWNKASEEVYGYSAREAIGKNLGDLIVPPDLKPLFAHCLELGKRVRRSGEFMPPGELMLLHNDGHLVPIYSIHTAVYLEGKEPLLFCIDVDLSERKRVEQALRESEEQYRELVENLNDVIYAVGPDEVITYVSPTIESFIGYKPSELIGRTFRHIIHPDDLEPLLKGYRGLLAGEPQANEYRVLSKSGEVRWMRTSSRPVFEGDRVVGLHGVLTDITERKRLEDQLRQAQKMEAVGRMAGGIAHDFNNLLTAIVGNSQMALDSLGDEAALRADLVEIKRAAERASALTRQLLAFSRRQVLQPTLLDLGEVAADTARILGRVLGEHIRIDLRPEPGLGCVEADHAQVQQVIMNLALNARDAMPNGGTLTIETADVNLDEAYARSHLGAEPGPYVRLTIADTGAGMDPETLSHIFEPFFTTKEPGKGTGLGLSTVYGIVKQSGGYVWIDSEPGRGTTVEVYLPRVDAPAELARPDGTPPASARGSETVLLAEDDAAVRNLACRILRDSGYTVLPARDGDEAIALSDRHDGPVHLLLADVVMPGLSGRELQARLEAHRPDLKALFVSGYTDGTIVHHGVLDPGIAFLQKPFTPEALTRRVRQVLDGPRGGQSGAAQPT